MSGPNGGRQVDRAAQREGADRCHQLHGAVSDGTGERSVDRSRNRNVDINDRPRAEQKIVVLHAALGHIFAEVKQHVGAKTPPLIHDPDLRAEHLLHT